MNNLQATPWDAAVFGMDCFEIITADSDTLAYAAKTPGHYTVKVGPLTDKRLLHQYGFYYTDTLIQPICMQKNWKPETDPLVNVDHSVTLDALLPMCECSFVHGRFHRDFNLPKEQADARYKQWLTQLYHSGNVLGLRYDGNLAGFIACKHGELLLHTIASSHRGRGLAKELWTAVISEVFNTGITKISSSISASNMPALNLYTSLGFRFENPVDIYHRLTY